MLISQTLLFSPQVNRSFCFRVCLLVRSLIFSIRSSGVFGFRLLTKLFDEVIYV